MKTYLHLIFGYVFTAVLTAIGAYLILTSPICYEHIEPQVEHKADGPEEISGWDMLTMAMILTESECDSTAVGTTQDLGILQITPIYVKEANRILDTAYFKHEDALSVRKSLDMYRIVQEHHNPQHDIDVAIDLHNPTSGKWHYNKVMKNYRLVKRYEEIRKEVVK